MQLLGNLSTMLLPPVYMFQLTTGHANQPDSPSKLPDTQSWSMHTKWRAWPMSMSYPKFSNKAHYIVTTHIQPSRAFSSKPQPKLVFTT